MGILEKYGVKGSVLEKYGVKRSGGSTVPAPSVQEQTASGLPYKIPAYLLDMETAPARTSSEVEFDLDQARQKLWETSGAVGMGAKNPTWEESRAADQRVADLESELRETKERERQALIDSGEYRNATLKDLTLGSFGRGVQSSIAGQESYRNMMTGGTETRARDALEADTYKFLPKGPVQEAISGAAQLLGQQARQWTDPRSVAMGTAAAVGASLLGKAGPQALAPEEVVTVPAAFLGGIQAGSVVSNFEIEAGQAYDEMIERGVSPKTAKTVALAVGGVNAALENLQMDELLKSFRVLKANGATKGAAQKVLEELGRRGLSVLNETAQEVAQEGATVAGVQAASYHDRGKPAYTGREVGKRLLDTAGASALSFGLAGVPGAARGVWSTTIQGGNAAAGPQITQRLREVPFVRAKNPRQSTDNIIWEMMRRRGAAESGKTTIQSLQKYNQDEAKKPVAETAKSVYNEREKAGDESRPMGAAEDPLSQEEKWAILSYKSSESYKINAKLNHGIELDPFQELLCRHLDSAISKLPPHKGGTLYRNLAFDDYGGKEEMDAFLSKIIVGKPVIFYGYTSTSETPDGYPVSGNYIVNVEIEGISGRRMAGYGNNSEKEVLFKRKTKYLPIEFTIGPKGHPFIRLIEMEEISNGS